MSHNLQKKPSRGILKTSRSVDGHDSAGTSHRAKEQRFDEMNIIETFHPADKDYGHMKIDEPKTPYAEPIDLDAATSDALDASELASKLAAAAAADLAPRCTEPPESSDEEESEEARSHRVEFQKKRKMHYNEFQALQLARKLMEQDEDEEEDGSIPGARNGASEGPPKP